MKWPLRLGRGVAHDEPSDRARAARSTATHASTTQSTAVNSALSDRLRVLDLVRRHGFNTTSFQVLESHVSYWWDSDDACVGYVDTGSAWVAAGAPLASNEDLSDVAERFVEAARKRGRRAVFFASQDRLVRRVAMTSVPVGLQPVWDPRSWSDTIARSRSLRHQLGRARRKSVVVRQVSHEELDSLESPTRQGVELVIERWLASRRMSRMEFLVAVQPFSFSKERRAFVAERNGRVVGFASAVPVYARDGWFVEDLLRDPHAPNGTAEALVDAVMQRAAAEGSTWVTLGLAPLAGDVPAWMRRVGRLTRPLYDFAGVIAFKSKLGPTHWEPVYVTHSNEVGTAAAITDSLRAFAGGGLSGFALRSVLHGPAAVLWVLGALLVPWMIVLAWVDARWFPSAGVRSAWLVFDAAVFVAMITLARNFTARLGRLTAFVVSMDAVLTCAQAVGWNLPRSRSSIEFVVVGVACAAPTLAAIVLWRRGLR